MDDPIPFPQPDAVEPLESEIKEGGTTEAEKDAEDAAAKAEGDVFIIMNGRGAWPDIRAKLDSGKLDLTRGPFQIARLTNATTNGLSTIAFRADLPDGRTVLLEMKMSIFLAVATRMAAAEGNSGAFQEAIRVRERPAIVDQNGKPAILAGPISAEPTIVTPP